MVPEQAQGAIMSPGVSEDRQMRHSAPSGASGTPAQGSAGALPASGPSKQELGGGPSRGGDDTRPVRQRELKVEEAEPPRQTLRSWLGRRPSPGWPLCGCCLVRKLGLLGDAGTAHRPATWAGRPLCTGDVGRLVAGERSGGVPEAGECARWRRAILR